MTTLDQTTKAELVREIATILAAKQRLAFASDFHAFAEGRELVLAGVSFENFPKGPDTKRSDGDVVAHAIVMALAGATNTGDIDDWFPVGSPLNDIPPRNAPASHRIKAAYHRKH